MRTKLRIWALLLVLVLAATAVAGCDSSGEEQSPSASVTPTVSTEPTESPDGSGEIPETVYPLVAEPFTFSCW